MFKAKMIGLGRGYAILLVLLGLLLSACSQDTDHDHEAGANGLYSCGMHPQVVQKEPGNCPICGMKLTPLRVENAGDMTTVKIMSSQEEGEETASVDSTRKTLYWRAPMDPTYISREPGKSPMGMDLIPVYEGQENQKSGAILIDPVTVQTMGIRTQKVQRQPFNRLIRTVGHVEYNEDRRFSVSIKFSGWIEKLFVSRTGDMVQKGQPLFTVYAPELVATQEEYLLAYKNAARLSTSGIGDVRASAQNLLRAAKQRLSYWDISPEQVQRLQDSGQIRKSLTIFSPADGVVEYKNVIEGAHVTAGHELFRISDLKNIWVLAHIYEYELPWIHEGQRVIMELPYVPGETFSGQIDYIYPFLSSKTRDVKIRLVFANPTLTLKPNMYANIEIKSSAGDSELVVPSEAIIRSGKRNIVFLSEGGGRFLPRQIIIGPEGENGVIKVKAGLAEGEVIVTSAQFLLNSESRLREAIQKMLDASQMTSQTR